MERTRTTAYQITAAEVEKGDLFPKDKRKSVSSVEEEVKAIKRRAAGRNG